MTRSSQRRYIEERLRYDSSVDFADFAGGIAAIVDDVYARIEDGEAHVAKLEELIKAIDRQSALNRTALMGDIDMGIEGVMAGQNKIETTLAAITSEVSQMRVTIESLKRMQTINIALIVCLVVLMMGFVFMLGIWWSTQ